MRRLRVSTEKGLNHRTIGRPPGYVRIEKKVGSSGAGSYIEMRPRNLDLGAFIWPGYESRIRASGPATARTAGCPDRAAVSCTARSRYWCSPPRTAAAAE